MLRVWKVTLQDGAFTVVRVSGKSLSVRDCIEILEYRGYKDTDIKVMEEVFEDDR